MIVLDASAVVDLLLDAPVAGALVARLAGEQARAPCHLDAEVLAALARLARAGFYPQAEVVGMLEDLARMAVEREPLEGLVAGAWARCGSLRTSDALYVELAAQLGTVVVTTDARLARATPLAELVGPPTLGP